MCTPVEKNLGSHLRIWPTARRIPLFYSLFNGWWNIRHLESQSFVAIGCFNWNVWGKLGLMVEKGGIFFNSFSKYCKRPLRTVNFLEISCSVQPETTSENFVYSVTLKSTDLSCFFSGCFAYTWLLPCMMLKFFQQITVVFFQVTGSFH